MQTRTVTYWRRFSVNSCVASKGSTHTGTSHMRIKTGIIHIYYNNSTSDIVYFHDAAWHLGEQCPLWVAGGHGRIGVLWWHWCTCIVVLIKSITSSETMCSVGHACDSAWTISLWEDVSANVSGSSAPSCVCPLLCWSRTLLSLTLRRIISNFVDQS